MSMKFWKVGDEIYASNEHAHMPVQSWRDILTVRIAEIESSYCDCERKTFVLYRARQIATEFNTAIGMFEHEGPSDFNWIGIHTYLIDREFNAQAFIRTMRATAAAFHPASDHNLTANWKLTIEADDGYGTKSTSTFRFLQSGELFAPVMTTNHDVLTHQAQRAKIAAHLSKFYPF